MMTKKEINILRSSVLFDKYDDNFKSICLKYKLKPKDQWNKIKIALYNPEIERGKNDNRFIK